MARGSRESHWLVMRRCLAIVRRVQRGPAQWPELLRAVLEQEGRSAYGDEEGEVRRLRLEKDLERIRQSLMVEVYFDRKADGYVIRDTWLPLLDLPDEDLATIAWLEQTFDHDSPQHDEVHALLGRLRAYLPPERQGQLEHRRTTLSLDLAQRDDDDISPPIWNGLTRALAERRRVEFSYLSPQQQDATPRRHVVDPYERYFDTVRGHYYLHGWCHVTDGPLGKRPQERYFDYRLGRIADLELLPNKLPPIAPPAPRYAVEYELTPQVARLGVTRQHGIQVEGVERRPDGSALVRGEAQSLLAAAQALLHYGANCRVLGGPELLAQMRGSVKKMGEIYAGEG